MFRITENPSSENPVQCLAKITGTILSCPLTWTRSVLWQHILTRCACVSFTLYVGTSYTVHKVQGSLMMDPLRYETCWSTFK